MPKKTDPVRTRRGNPSDPAMKFAKGSVVPDPSSGTAAIGRALVNLIKARDELRRALETDGTPTQLVERLIAPIDRGYDHAADRICAHVNVT